jgi:menaquinone-specific isochorismate synthase
MTIIPLPPDEQATPEKLSLFFSACREEAVQAEHAKLISISLAVSALDPLAVLEAIFEPTEPHFYAERPAIGTAIAGAEPVHALECAGPGRFAAAQAFIDETLAHTIAVGDVHAPMGGPHFFTTFTFEEEQAVDAPFAAGRVFVPRWQVARAGDVTTAVANLVVKPTTTDGELAALVDRLWRARARFLDFRFEETSGGGFPPPGAGASTHSATRGTGVPPVSFANQVVTKRQGAYLPHWTAPRATYAVTFRLADSLPQEIIETWRARRDDLRRQLGEATAQAVANSTLVAGWSEQLAAHEATLDALLDEGRGSCLLRAPEAATLVEAGLKHFDGARYTLIAWCVMPNHVHVVVQPTEGQELSAILHSWKSFTAHELKKRGLAANLAAAGVWQPESYDQLIRSEDELERIIAYVMGNPAKAGLAGWAWLGQAGHHGRDARATVGEARSAAALPYPAAVQAALGDIAAGRYHKIVLARTIDHVAPAPLHPLRALNRLRERFPDCYSFSVANGRGQSFIGASPERLVRVSQGALETEALAGSARRGATASEDATLGGALLHSDKDRREQRLVLDSIVRRLAPLGLVCTHPAEPALKRLANVQHLLTPIRAEVPPGVRLLDALAVLHPTPAVGGSPREAALPRIAELEDFSRGLYAGAIGWINSRGGGEFFVGLRSALVADARATLFVGAGIVAGSDPEKEQAETELKARALADALIGAPSQD